MTVAELMVEKSLIEKKLAQAQLQERSMAIAKALDLMAEFRALMAQHGLTHEDIHRPVAVSASRAKAAIKYLDPLTGNTWSGRGRPPRWVSAALRDGKPLQDFLAPR
jgi:DNA-binding protein H-NS